MRETVSDLSNRVTPGLKYFSYIYINQQPGSLLAEDRAVWLRAKQGQKSTVLYVVI